MYSQKLQSRFRNYVNEKKLFKPKKILLVAVSGGLDSICLCHLLSSLGYKFAIAHFNFQLRDADSDLDEAFVRDFSDRAGIIFHLKRGNASEYAKKNRISTQEAARELRYEWFREVCDAYKYQCVVTGHHLDDSIETFFINLLRGTGIRGLRGILPISGNRVRPLLFATKEELIKYAKENNLSYREDSSNLSDDYTRNKIRHHLVPQLKMLHPTYPTQFLSLFKHLEACDIFLDTEIEKLKKKFVKLENGNLTLDKKAIQKIPQPGLFLFSLMRDFGFNRTQIENVTAALKSREGKYFKSGEFDLIVRNGDLEIQRRNKKEEDSYFIPQGKMEITRPIRMKISIMKATGKRKIVFLDSPYLVYLDADRVVFPLEISGWKAGERFQPLGMKTFKKLSDFFISLKMNRFEKESQFILRSAGEVVWVVGRRIDNRFKVQESTRNILKFEIGKSKNGFGKKAAYSK